MTDEKEFSVVRYLIRVLVFGTLLGVVLFLVYLGVAIVKASG